MNPALLNSVVGPSESGNAMQYQHLTETIPEQLYTPAAATQGELATETSQTTQNTQAIQAWLAKIERKAHRDKKMFWGLFAFFQAFLFFPIALISVLPLIRNGHFNLVVLAMLCLPSFGMVAMALRFAFKKSDWNAEEMTRVGGVQAVGTLLELLGTPQPPRKMKPLFVALTILLPQMKASDAGLLTVGQRKLLYAMLNGGLSVFGKPDLLFKYRLAVLKALEQIGDADAVPIVENLANGKARSARQKAIKAAAIECLPLLLVNFRGVEATKTLLRASSLGDATHETLLHPIEFTPDAVPKQFLHAAETPSPLPPVRKVCP